jgi:diguanylate cyclase (GGDEF)-like protein
MLVKNQLNKSLIKEKIDYERLKYEYDKITKENERVKEENAALEKSVEETIALYDIAKDIRKTLDENEMFKLFKERINAYIQLNDCLFLKADSELVQYKNYTTLPLTIENNTIGYLLASGIQEKDKEKFNILAHQFLSGIKGAYLFKKVQELTVIDSLTQVFNRRYFLERFNEEIERSNKFKYKLSFLMADIDHFKEINDNFGHLVGDAILKEATKTIKENIRQIDFMGRFGGEELSIILTETEKEKARFVSERIRQAIESRNFKVYDEDLKITISIGLSTFPNDACEAIALIDKADAALYKAKQLGRNRVCIYESPK